MAYCFGDSFDLYAAVAELIAGYWEGATIAGVAFVAGRFGGQALSINNANGSQVPSKTSAVNDAIHHFVVAFRQTAALSGTTAGVYIQLIDGATNQCAVVFRSDGAILLTSGGPTGTTLATYASAVTLQNQWFAFEIEVVVNNTTGSFTVRKNGNTSNDFTLGSLNTRSSANNYANKITIGMSSAVNAQQIDDFLWRSDASSVPWVGDIRCYTRMPASDAAVQFTRIPVTQSVAVVSGTSPAIAAGTARYTAPLTAPCDCSIGTVVVSLASGYTGNMKCSLFASSGAGPLAVLGSATPISNPATGSNTFTFPTPVTLSKGTQYIVGFDSDTSSGTWSATTPSTGYNSTTAYASFPTASPVTTGAQPQIVCTITTTPTTNNSLVNEPQQDGTTTYVYDSNVNDADLYGIASIGVTPASTVAVTTRGFLQKSDAGSRSGAVQLKSGATTVNSGSAALSTTWAWMWRTDTTDPATSAAWTATGANNVQIGPVLTA